MRIVEPSVTALSVPTHALDLIEKAGRVCYRSESKGDSNKFVRMLIKRGHESVLEHVGVSFQIVCDRGVSHELVRHRIASFSQESTRYCNYGGEDIAFIEPPGMTQDQKFHWRDSVCTSEIGYKHMLVNGATPQIARSVLPNALKTEIVMTANFREWRHFLRLRCAKESHPQMREIAHKIRSWFHDNYPVIVENLQCEW